MTPDKSKRPLPSSVSTNALDQPKTPQEWRYALGLVKAAYLKGQWKQCSAQCDHLMTAARIPPMPLHAASLWFYAALSQEAIARQMHGMSLAKVSALQQAKSFFEQAAAALPRSELEVFEETSEDGCSTRSSSAMGDALSLNDSISSLEGPDTRYSSISSISSPIEDRSSISDLISRFPPLRVRKIAQPAHASISSQKSFFEAMTSITRPNSQQYQSAPGLATSAEPALDAVSPRSLTPLAFEMPDQAPSVISKSEESAASSIVPTDTGTAKFQPFECASPDLTPLWVHQRAQELYQEHLQDFAQMLQRYIDTSQDLIGKTEEAQVRRMSEDKQTMPSDDEDSKHAGLRARITRLKENGWKRERFDPQRYQDLAEMALAEL